MTHFGFLKSRAVSIFSRTASRERRLENTRKSLARKILDQFLLEKMEDRWLPTVSITTGPGGTSLFIRLSASNDGVFIQRTGGSTTSDSVNITATNALPISSFAGITNIDVFDLSGTNTGQTLVFQDGSVGNFVSAISSCSIETINVSTRLTGSLGISGTASQLTGSVANSQVSSLTVTNSNLTIVAPSVLFNTVSASDSTLYLTAASLGGTSVTTTESNVFVTGSVVTDFSQTSITASGGSFFAAKDSKINTVVLNTGITQPSALFANAANATAIVINGGSLTTEGNIQTLTQTGGTMTVRRSPGTVISTVDNPKIGTLSISGGTATIQDDAIISGLTSISGVSTVVTFQAGSNYTPTIGASIISNGLVNVGNTTINGAMSISAGTVSLTDSTANALIGMSGGTVSVLRGSYSAAIQASGGSLSIDGASISNANNSSPTNPALSLSGASTSVFNSSITAKAGTNAVEVSGGTFSVNMGNTTSPGNNTFSILPGGTPYFIKNTSLNTVNAVGNTWNYNGIVMPNSTPSDGLAIASYILGAGASSSYGLVYFNPNILYVLNNQAGGVNSISSVSDKAGNTDTIYIEGGPNVFVDNVQVVGKSLSFIGVANSTGTNPILGANSSTVASPFFRFFEDPTLLTPVSIQNVISNVTFDSTGLTGPEADSAILIDGQYYVNGSSLTLSGATTSTGYNTGSNPSMIKMAGGQLNLSTSSTLVSSLQFNPSADSTFVLSSGSTVNGPLSITSVPSGLNFSATIAGTLNGPASSPIALFGGTVTVTGTGTVTGSPISIQGATFNLNGGTITSEIIHDSGTLNITGGISSGSLTITGGVSAISGGTFDASTASNPSAVSGVITITGGTSTFTGGTVNADNNGTTYRDGIRIDGSSTGYIGSTVSISGLNVTLTPTNNISTAGIRTLGVNSTLYNAPNTVLTLGDGTTITNGDFSIVIGGVNSCLTGNKFGNLTLRNPDGTGFIKLTDSTYFNDQTRVAGHLDASQISYDPFYAGAGGSFRPASTPFDPTDNVQMQRLFTLESKMYDYTFGQDVGFVEIYPAVVFALNSRQLQRAIDVVNTSNSQLMVQSGTYNESITIDSSKTGLQLLGPTSYGNITPAILAPVSGSNAAAVVQADNVLISGFSFSGANGSTPLLSNLQLSGTSYGVTNFNGTSATAIANLTVTDSVFNNFINAGVYLQDNGTKAASTISDNSFTSIGVYGYNGGVVLSNSFAAVDNNTMTKVTNGVVLRDVSAALTGSADITKNTIDAYATGITVQGYSSPSSFTIGGGSNFNALSLATGMNTTLPSPSSTDNTGLYLVGIAGSAVPTIADNNVSGFSLGYYLSNITQPMTISGGSITSAFRGVIVATNATTNPNGGALGVGSSIANVTASGVSVSSLYTSGIAFRVVGVNSGTGPTLTLDGGTSYTASTAANTTAACITNRGIFVVNNASLVDNGLTANGIYNSNSTVTINSPASISNFKSGRYAIQQVVGGSTTINGGSIVGSGEQVRVTAGTLNINGGTISSTGSNNTLHFSGTTGTIGSSVGNTLITANSGSALFQLSGNVSITQGTNSTNLTSAGARVVNQNGGNLSISGGNLYSSNASATVVSVFSGTASVSGGSISNASVGVGLSNSATLLTVSGGTISGSASGVSASAGNADITGGRITSPNIGVNFNSSGTLNVLNGSSSDITGFSGSGILIQQGTGNINGGTISGSAVGINFNNSTSGGSVSNVVFISGQSDLQLNQTNGLISLGANNSFSGSASTPGDAIGYILNKTTQSFTLDPSTRFLGTPLSSLSVPADLSTLYSIQDKIVDGLDNQAYGLVRLKASTLLVTPLSFYTPASVTTPSIQRGVDLSSTGDTLWIKSGSYPDGIDTTGKIITIGTGDGISVGPVDVTTGDLTFSSTTTLKVRLMGNTTGSYSQINMQTPTVPVNFSNACIVYSNENGFTPTVGDNFKVINQPSSVAGTSTRFTANVVGTGTTVLQDQQRYQLASGQYFATLYQGITGTDRNDFVLVSVPEFVTNVVVYNNWSSLYFGDPVSYVDSAGVTNQLTYGVSAAANISNGFGQLQVPSGSMGTISIANSTYAEALGGYSASNLTINVIGACSSTSTALGNVNGNITVDSINLNSCTTLNMRVNAGSGFTTFDQITTNGTIALNNAYGNFSFNGNFSNPGLTPGNFLKLINNTNGTNVISGRFRYANGTTIINGSFFPVSGQSDKGFYSTYTLGTAAPYDDFAMIYNYQHGSVPNVAVNQAWDTSNLDFGAFVTVGNTTYTIGIDAFGQMRDYTPAGGVTLVGGVTAVSPTGNIQIAAGSYNGTFTVDKGFTLTGPTTGNATFPAATGQTVLRGNSTSAANITAGSWTNNLLFGNLLVGNGTIFDNAARLIDDNGSLYFQSGVTFPNVSLSTGKSILISGNIPGSPATLLSATGGTVITVSGSNVNATLTDLNLGGTGTGVNLTNTGVATFNTVLACNTLGSIGTINGPTTLTLNYPTSTVSNTLTVRNGSLNFTPLGSSNLSLTAQNAMTFNANIGTSATPGGNNTIVLAANSTFAGGVIATGSGVDAFTISAPQPMTIKGGSGNDTLSIAAANAYLSSYDGEAGVNTFRAGPNSVNYIDLGAAGTGGAYLSRGNTTTRSAFANVAKVYGNGFSDVFSVTDNSASFSLVNGGNGNDQLIFSGTSGANASFDVSRQLFANVTGSSSGAISYFNFANSTATVSMVDSFVSVENLKGGSGDDTFKFSHGGSLGGSLNGGLGNNTLDYTNFLLPSASSISTGVRVDLTTGSSTAIGGTSTGRVTGIRDIYGTVGIDMLRGDAGNNIIDGGDGADSILGEAGNDFLIGGLGTDTLRGSTGDNIDIGGYVNFDQGGTTSAYGVPTVYKPFVLRSMMNAWSTGNQSDVVFNTNALTLETSGVSVQVPGNTTSYTGIRLFTATSVTDPVRGTVFDDGAADTLDMQNSAYNWIFIPPIGDLIINGTPKKVTYIYKLIP